jgi:Amt family ammonium transporter
MGTQAIDILWIVLSAGLVFVMQAGFLCLETGLTRSKNNINVAIKNLADFALSTVLFWAFGYALMFGASEAGLLGSTDFFPDYGEGQTRLFAFLLFQIMFCGTAVTIISGAIAERIRFSSYLIVAALVSGLIYPIFGHWAWNGVNLGEATGWLGDLGFRDFAGSSVVHSVGGWSSLALLLILGSRIGRFENDGTVRQIPGSNIPMASLGIMLLWFGWFGFNGGSTLRVAAQEGDVAAQSADLIVRVLMNTVMAGAFGTMAAMFVGWFRDGQAKVDHVMNGALAGLVAITANANVVSLSSSVFIGIGGGLVMLLVTWLLERMRLDDAVGAVPVHLGAGIWGTLCVGIFGQSDLLGTGIGRGEQIMVQALGIVVCGVWTFGITYSICWLINRVHPLRVSSADEYIGLNVSEHGAATALLELFEVMKQQQETGDLSLRVPVEPFTEVGQIGQRYNMVMNALESAVRRTETIVRSAMDGIITFSNDTLSIQTLNPAAEAILGVSHEQFSGHSMAALFQTSYGEGSRRSKDIRSVLTTEGLSEMVAKRSDGSTLPIEMAIAISSTSDGEFNTGIFRDLSERKAYEQDILMARDAAEAANRSKSTFLANMSHELRTPLNAVIGYGELLLTGIYGELSEKQRDRIVRMVQNGRLLLEQINSVLDLSKIEAGRMDVYYEMVDIHTLVNTIVSTVTPLVHAKKNRLSVDLGRLIGTMRTDSTKLQQVLLNILSNAAKFSEDGEIKLVAERRIQDRQEWIDFTVSDTGIGMTEEELQRAFNAFEQADLSTTRQYGGTGLGLAICQQFVDLLHGYIEVETAPNVGSTFIISLPAHGDQQTVITGEQGIVLDSPATLSNINSILVIDDDTTVHELLTHYIGQQGFAVYAASSGEEGLELAAELKPSLIILDIMMPKMDGWTVLNNLKADPVLAKIPVIILTIVDNRATAFRLGASEFVMKPIDPKHLVATLNRYRCANPPCPILVIEDDASTRHMLRDLLESEGWAVTDAENGRVGLARVQENRPVLIILDLMMPEMDGFEFITHVKNSNEYQHIPIIVVTARDLSPEEQKNLIASTQRVVQKGDFQKESLMNEIQALVQQLLN